MTLEINFDIDRQLLDKAIDQKLDDSFIKHQKSQVTLTPFKWVLSGKRVMRRAAGKASEKLMKKIFK